MVDNCDRDNGDIVQLTGLSSGIRVAFHLFPFLASALHGANSISISLYSRTDPNRKERHETSRWRVIKEVNLRHLSRLRQKDTMICRRKYLVSSRHIPFVQTTFVLYWSTNYLCQIDFLRRPTYPPSALLQQSISSSALRWHV